MIKSGSEEQELKANEFVKKLLVGTFLAGFRFDTSFSLEFHREGLLEIDSHSVSNTLLFVLLGDWSLEMDESNLPFEVPGDIEPESIDDESIKAAQLARLRWSDGSTVKDIDFDDERLAIHFYNGAILSVNSRSIDDESWYLRELQSDTLCLQKIYQVSCMDGEICVCKPQG